MILYPALDLLDGRAVRLTRGDYATARVYSENPAGVLAGFRAAGAACAHLVDLNGARDPSARQQKILEPLLKESSLKVQVGGGVRSRADAEQLLSWGADRVVLGSAAVADPELVEATDARLETLIARFRAKGLARVLCTDISRDGAAAGPNAGLYRTLASAFAGLEVQASGGVRHLADLEALKAAGAHSAIVGTALYEKTLDLKEALAAC
jgi:phosphoribosylformimino-5-aminoimidazole carboxamide ribotide isomerase